MTNYATGHLAEKYACEYLKQQGYKVITTNWRTRYCEIDIIAMHKKRLYFIEVKHRNTRFQGGGMDYITERKQRQMKFASRLWIAENRWDKDYSLGVIEISGPDFEVTQFLPEL